MRSVRTPVHRAHVCKLGSLRYIKINANRFYQSCYWRKTEGVLSLRQIEIEKRLAPRRTSIPKISTNQFTERSELLHAVAELLFQEKHNFAETITLEMGKLFHDSVAEIEKCARGCRFYAENGARFLEQETAQTDAAESYVEYQPLGPVLAIMPWNFPFWQVFRFAAPALMAGNVGLLKHASNVPQCALAIENIFCRAGFEDGVFQTLMIEPEQVEKLIIDARVKAVTLTGSEKAGVPWRARPRVRSRKACSSLGAAMLSSSCRALASSGIEHGREGADDQHRSVLYRGETIHHRRSRFTSISLSSSSIACARSGLATPWIRKLTSGHSQRNKFCKACTIKWRNRSRQGQNC